MMFPAPKIVVVDDNKEDVDAIVRGLADLGTTALGVHYSPNLVKPPILRGLRILFLDLHLLGAGDSGQQLKATVGILEDLLAPDCGPYVVILWSSHVSELATLFLEEARRRLPPELLPLQIFSLDKTEFITTREGGRRVDEPKRLTSTIQEKIKATPQLVALLSWEEEVARAAADTVDEIFHMARRRNGSEPAAGLNHLLGDLAAAAVGRKNAGDDVFRGVNDVLAPVLLDRLLHRNVGEETAQLWKSAVTVRERNELPEDDAALLNRFLHVEDGKLRGQVRLGERGSVIALAADRLTILWGLGSEDLIKEFCLASSKPTWMEWCMVQVQPPCDQAQQNPGLLPCVLGLYVRDLNTSRRSEIKKRKHLWLSPPLKVDNEVSFLITNHRFVAGLPRNSELLQGSVLLRLRDQLLAELTHELHSYNGRPGVIRFPE
jgi:hypothetical protein